MARPGTKAATMYMKDEVAKAFEAVKEHYGDTYSASEVLSDLVRKKYHEITYGKTHRKQLDEVCANVAALHAANSQLEARLLAMEQLLKDIYWGRVPAKLNSDEYAVAKTWK